MTTMSLSVSDEPPILVSCSNEQPGVVRRGNGPLFPRKHGVHALPSFAHMRGEGRPGEKSLSAIAAVTQESIRRIPGKRPYRREGAVGALRRIVVCVIVPAH